MSLILRTLRSLKRSDTLYIDEINKLVYINSELTFPSIATLLWCCRLIAKFRHRPNQAHGGRLVPIVLYM